MSRACVPDITIGEIVGALVVVDGDESIHESTRGHHRHIAQRAGAAFLLGGQPAAAEALRIAYDGVDFGILYGLENPRGFLEVGR